MYQGIRPYVTTGVALVGASVIAVSPVAVPPPEIHATPIATTQRVVTSAEVQLASLTSLAVLHIRRRPALLENVAN